MTRQQYDAMGNKAVSCGYQYLGRKHKQICFKPRTTEALNAGLVCIQHGLTHKFVSYKSVDLL